MSAMNADEIYERHIRPLPPAQRLRILTLIGQELAGEAERLEAKPRRSIMDLHGLGAGIWEGVDAQEYVDELRTEWE